MKEVITFLKKHLHDEDTVIIGCSGGSDSMCLLSLVVSNFKNVKIICAHVNHKVRKESEEEYQYVKNYCKDNGIIFEGTEIPQAINSNFEAEARKFRYNFFETLFNKYNAKYILTAHHADDLVETILMRMSRGSNLSGYAGIKMIDGIYLRPFLLIDKEIILNYLQKNKISFFEDYTNQLDDHTRNRYRHQILPFLKKESNKLNEKYLKFSNELQEYDNFIQLYIVEKNLIVDKKIYVDKLLAESDFIKRKVLEALVKEYQKEDLLEITDKHVTGMLNLIKSPKSNSRINITNGYIGKKNYNEFTIVKQTELDDDYEDVLVSEFYKNNWHIWKGPDNSQKSNFILRLNSKEIKLPLIIRNRRDGDSMKVKNLGTKKIKDIFIDDKVRLDLRDKYPLVVDSSGNILWLPGLKKSEFDKEKNEKYDIILYSERKDTDE